MTRTLFKDLCNFTSHCILNH